MMIWLILAVVHIESLFLLKINAFICLIIKTHFCEESINNLMNFFFWSDLMNWHATFSHV